MLCKLMKKAEKIDVRRDVSPLICNSENLVPIQRQFDVRIAGLFERIRTAEREPFFRIKLTRDHVIGLRFE